MKNNILRPMLASLVVGATLVSATALPAKADSAATTRLLAGAAAAAAIFTAVNVEHKHQIANTIQGYLPNGSTVYADGHVVSRNGRSWYPGNNGQEIACDGNQQCSITGNRSNNGGYNGNYRYGNLNGYEESNANGWHHRH
ncbi:MAG: hypothetical protein ACXWNK_18120 [Vulcanimicrobiaceae bacterium]